MPGPDLYLDVSRLVVGLEKLGETLSGVRDDLRLCIDRQNESDCRRAVLVERFDYLVREHDNLIKLVRDGNGQPSIVYRLSQFENKQRELTAQIVEFGVDLAELQRNYGTAVISRGQMISGVIGIVLTAVLSIASVLVALFKQ